MLAADGEPLGPRAVPPLPVESECPVSMYVVVDDAASLSRDFGEDQIAECLNHFNHHFSSL